MPIFITSPECFLKLKQLEGGPWADRQNLLQNRTQRENFFAVRKAYMDAQQQSPDAPTDLMENRTIYGEGGYARYVVQKNGEVVLDGSSVRREKATLAEAAGVRVV